VYDDDQAYYYKTDITNYNYDANADTWIPILGTETPAQKEEPVRPPSQSVSISNRAHRRMSISATGHMYFVFTFRQNDADLGKKYSSEFVDKVQFCRFVGMKTATVIFNLFSLY
jgi:hypothetical protein